MVLRRSCNHGGGCLGDGMSESKPDVEQAIADAFEASDERKSPVDVSGSVDIEHGNLVGGEIDVEVNFR